MLGVVAGAVTTADNGFIAYVNGTRAKSGDKTSGVMS
jgi:hypothetical protein